MSEIKELEAILFEVSQFYSKIRKLMLKISSETRNGEFTKEELCDLGFLCRETVIQCEEIRKDIGATKILVDKIMCIKVMSAMLTSQSGEDLVHGTLASGIPNYKKSITLPKKDTPEFEKMMKYFGISLEGIDMGIAKISWKKVCDHVTELAELGKPLPDFIPKIHDDYTVIHRRKSM